MKAIACTKYGSPDFLELRDIQRPIPKHNEVLVKIHATPVTTADTMMRRGVPRFARLFLGLSRPNKEYIGTGFAGVVAAIGKDVTTFAPGDRVCGETGLNFGAYAEYATVAADGAITKMPDAMPFEEAAPIGDGAMTVMNFLTVVTKLEKGQKILIIGASGGLGTAAVQIAQQKGAEVTAVCSARNHALVQSLGAQHVIDYATQDYTRLSQRYDVIFDTVGKSDYCSARRALVRGGVYLSPVLTLSLLFHMLVTSTFSTKKAKFSATGLMAAADLRGFLGKLTEMFETDRLKTIIDRGYTLDQMAEAHRYVDTGHKRGNVIVTMA